MFTYHNRLVLISCVLEGPRDFDSQNEEGFIKMKLYNSVSNVTLSFYEKQFIIQVKIRFRNILHQPTLLCIVRFHIIYSMENMFSDSKLFTLNLFSIIYKSADYLPRY